MAGPRREHLPDKLLYRDEAWFESVERERKEGEEKGKKKQSSHSETMTAPPEEQGDAGPLVPCKVGQQKSHCFNFSINQNFFRFAVGVLQRTV